VVLTPAGPDTIAKDATLQYTAVLKDSAGNTVGGTVTWSSSPPAIASVSTNGLATGLAGDSTRIIALAGGYADTAWLFVRALRSIAVTPADTIITSVDDSVTLTGSGRDNFGGTVATGLVIRYLSATPTVATIVNAVTGRVRIVGPGNAVVVARDSITGVQGTATLRVVQTPVAVVNAQDSIQVGVSGRGQIVAQALDRKNHPIPGRTFGWATRGATIATVDASGMVTGVALGSTYVVDSLVDGVNVYKDSTRISVVPAPPAVIQWAYDSTAVGNGSNLVVAISLTRPSAAAPLIVKLTSSDTMIARTSVRAVTIPQGQSGTSVQVNGLQAGRVTLIAQDSSGLGYAPDTMVVTVVSTIEFREIGSSGRQSNFYVNNHETHRARVFLSDPAPAGGLGVTFVYGYPGRSFVTPAPAIIPAGQLAADVVITGVAAGRDSVIPTSGGFVGNYANVYVAPESLQFYQAYPYTGVVGLGQSFQPYVAITYGMDHPLIVAVDATPGGIVSRPDTITLPTNATYRYFDIGGLALGSATVTVSAPGWVSRSLPIRVSTPHLSAYATTTMVAGDPTRGYWYTYTTDSLNYEHEVIDTVRVTVVSRSPTAVAVDSSLGKALPGASYTQVNNALRALPGAGGDSAWIVFTAPGYVPDSVLVHVQPAALSHYLGYPYDGRVPHGTRLQNAAYVQIPYARTDTFWVTLGHTRRGVLGGPDSVRILPGQLSSYYDVQGDSLGVDTISVTRATGYVVSGGPIAFRVDRPKVQPYSYSATLYTISQRQAVSVAVLDSLTNQARPLLAPMTVSVAARNPAAFTLDSATVTIPAGGYVSNYDTLRVQGVDTVGSRIVATAAGAATDSSNLIRVYPTPLSVQVGYPYQVSRGLVLPANRVYLTGGTAPAAIQVALSHTNAGAFALKRDTVTIPAGQSQSDTFSVAGLDSIGTDTLIATATGYVTGRAAINTQPSRLDMADPGPNHLTTDAPVRLITYTETRNGYGLNPDSAVTFTIVSSNPSVLQIDSAGFVHAAGDTATSTVPTNLGYGYFRLRYAGSGTARLYVSAPGFDRDSTNAITVTGPTLHVYYPTVTLGLGQVFASQRIYVDNPVTSPLVVKLQRSDSTLPPANRVFNLTADSVIIATGQNYSPPFDVTANAIGAAQLIARAAAYSQAIGTVDVNQPRLEVASPTLTGYVGQRPYNNTVYAEDESGSIQSVAAPLVVTATSSDPTIGRSDSATKTVAAGSSSTFFPLRSLKKGSVDIVYSAPGYIPDTTMLTVDTATLNLSVPSGLGPGQQIVNGMSVSLPYVTDSLLVLSLSSTNTGVLTVPLFDTIPAGGSSASFTITGVALGQADIIVTAPHSYPDTQRVTVGTPRLFVSLASTTSAGQQYSISVTTQDSLGNTRAVSAPLTVTLASSVPGHTAIVANPITINTGSSSASTQITFDTAGVYTITATAPAYNQGVATTTTGGALVRMIPGSVFSPATITIPAGRTVTWRNDDAITHTTTSTTPWNSGNMLPGQTFSRTFSTPGTFTYQCSIHGAAMSGTVIVQ
jgi:plastocyanin